MSEPYAVVREVLFVSNEEGIGIFTKDGQHLARVLFENDKTTIGDVPEGQFVNPVHSGNLSRFVSEGDGFQDF